MKLLPLQEELLFNNWWVSIVAYKLVCFRIPTFISLLQCSACCMNDRQWHSETTFCPFVFCVNGRINSYIPERQPVGLHIGDTLFLLWELKGCGVFRNYKERSESNAFCFFLFLSLYKLDMWKFQRTSPQNCWKSECFFFFRCSLHALSTVFHFYKQEHVFPPDKSCSYSAATGAVPRHWLNYALVGFLTTKNMIIWWRKVRTVGWMRRHYPSRICDDLRCCVRPIIVVGHCLWEELD